MSDNNGAIAAALLGVAVAAEELNVEKNTNSNNDVLANNDDVLSNNDYQSNNDFLSKNDDILSNNDLLSNNDYQSHNDFLSNNDDVASNNDYHSNNDFLSKNDDVLSNNDLLSHNDTDVNSNNDFLSDNNDVLSNNDLQSHNDTDIHSNNDFLSGNDDIASNNDIASHNTTDVHLEDVAFGGDVTKFDLDVDIRDSFNVNDTDWIDLDNVSAGPITVFNAGGHIFTNVEVNSLSQTQTNTMGDVNVTDADWCADDPNASLDAGDIGTEGSASSATINDSINLDISMGANIQQNVVTFNVVGGDGNVDIDQA